MTEFEKQEMIALRLLNTLQAEGFVKMNLTSAEETFILNAIRIALLHAAIATLEEHQP